MSDAAHAIGPWPQKRLKFCASYNDEVLPEATDDFKLIDYVEISDVSLSGGIENSTPMLFHEAPSRARRKVRSGDILISTVRTYLKAIAAVRVASDELIASTGFCVVRPSEDLNSAFAGWAVKSDQFVGEVVSRSVGVSYPAINASQLVDLSIPLPPLKIQRRIAAFLDEKTAQIDALIARKQVLLERLAEKRQAIITQAVTKGLDPDAPMRDSGIDWLGQIPAHWEVKRLKFSTLKIGSGVTPRGGASVYVDEGVMLLRSQNIHFDGLQLSDVAYIDPEIDREMAATRVQTADVLLNITGASIGRCCVYDQDAPANVNQHVCIIRPTEEIHSEFLAWCLTSPMGQLQIDLSQNGASREGLSFGDLGDFIVPAPKKNEQVKVAAFVNGAVSTLKLQTRTIAQSVTRLQEYRAALITSAVTGQIDGLR